MDSQPFTSLDTPIQSELLQGSQQISEPTPTATPANNNLRPSTDKTSGGGGSVGTVISVDVTAILNLLTNDSINLLREEMLEGDTPLLEEEEKRRRSSSISTTGKKGGDDVGLPHPPHDGYKYYPNLMEETQLHNDFRRSGGMESDPGAGSGKVGGDSNGDGVKRDTFLCLVYNICARSNPALVFAPSQYPSTKRRISVVGREWRSSPTALNLTPTQASLRSMEYSSWENKVLPDSNDINYLRITSCAHNTETMTQEEQILLARREALAKRQRQLDARRALRKALPPQSNMTETQIKFMWQINDLFTVIDVNNNGDVSWEEFSHYVISSVETQGGKTSAEIAEGTSSAIDMKSNANTRFNISTALQFQHTGFTTTSSHRVNRAEMFFVPHWGKYALLETGEGVEAAFLPPETIDNDTVPTTSTDSHVMKRMKQEQRNSGVAKIKENSRISLYKPLPRVIASVADVLGKEDDMQAVSTPTAPQAASSSTTAEGGKPSNGKKAGPVMSHLQRARQQLQAGGSSKVTGPKVETQGHSVKLHSEFFSDYPIDAVTFSGASLTPKALGGASSSANAAVSLSSIACMERKQLVEKNRIKMNIMAAQQVREKRYESLKHRRHTQQLQAINMPTSTKTKNSALERAQEQAAEEEDNFAGYFDDTENNTVNGGNITIAASQPHLCCSTRGGKLMFLSMVDDPVKEEAGIITPLNIVSEQFLDCDPTALGPLSSGSATRPIGRTTVLRWDEELPSLLFAGGTNSMISLIQVDPDSLLSCTPNVVAQYDHHCPQGNFSVATAKQREAEQELTASVTSGANAGSNSLPSLGANDFSSVSFGGGGGVSTADGGRDSLDATTEYVDLGNINGPFNFNNQQQHSQSDEENNTTSRKGGGATFSPFGKGIEGSVPILDICLLPERGTKRMISSSLDGQMLLFDLTTETILGDFFTGITETNNSDGGKTSGGDGLSSGGGKGGGGIQSVFAPVHKMAYSNEYSLLVSCGINESNPIIWTPFSATSRFVRQLTDVDDSALSSGSRGARRQQDKCLQDVKIIPGTPYFMTADLGGMMKVWDFRNLSFSVAQYVDGVDSRHDFFHSLGGGQQAFTGAMSTRKRQALDRFRRKHGQGNVGIFSPEEEEDPHLDNDNADDDTTGGATGNKGTGADASSTPSESNLFVNLKCRCFGVEPGRGEIVTYSRNVQDRQTLLAGITGGLGVVDQTGPGVNDHGGSNHSSSKPSAVPGGNVLHCFRALSAPAHNPLTTHDTEIVSSNGSFATNNSNSFGILQMANNNVKSHQLSLTQMQDVFSSTLEFLTAGGMAGPLQFSFYNVADPLFELPSPNQLLDFYEAALESSKNGSSNIALKNVPPFLTEAVDLPLKFTSISGDGIKLWNANTGFVTQVMNIPLLLPEDNEKDLLNGGASSKTNNKKKADDGDDKDGEGSPHSGDDDGSADLDSPNNNSPIRFKSSSARRNNRRGTKKDSNGKLPKAETIKEVLVRCSITACAVEATGRRLIVGTDRGHVLLFSSMTASKIGECRRHQFDWSAEHMKNSLESQRGTSPSICHVLAIFLTPSATAPPPSGKSAASDASAVNPYTSFSLSKREVATQYYHGSPVLPSDAVAPRSKVLSLGQDGYIFVTDIAGDIPVYLFRIYVGNGNVVSSAPPPSHPLSNNNNDSSSSTNNANRLLQPLSSDENGGIDINNTSSKNATLSLRAPAKITVCSVSATLQLCVIGLSNGAIEVRDISMAPKHRHTWGTVTDPSSGSSPADENNTPTPPATASALDTKNSNVAGTCICILAPFRNPSAGSSLIPISNTVNKRGGGQHHTSLLQLDQPPTESSGMDNNRTTTAKKPPRAALHAPLPHKVNASSKKTRLAALLKRTREQSIGTPSDMEDYPDPSIINAETDVNVEAYLLPPAQEALNENSNNDDNPSSPTGNGADEVTALISCDPRPFCVSGDSRGFLQVFAVRPHPLATAHLSSAKDSPSTEDSNKTCRIARWKTYHPRATALVFPVPVSLQWVEAPLVTPSDNNPTLGTSSAAAASSSATTSSSGDKLLVVGDDMGTITVWDLSDLVSAFGLFKVSNPALPGSEANQNVDEESASSQKSSAMSPNTQPKLRANFSIASKPIRTLQVLSFSSSEILRFFNKSSNVATSKNARPNSSSGVVDDPKDVGISPSGTSYETLPPACFKLTSNFLAVGVGEGKRVSFWSISDGCVTVPYLDHEPAPLHITGWGGNCTSSSRNNNDASNNNAGSGNNNRPQSPSTTSHFPHRLVRYVAGDFLGCLMQGRGTSFQHHVFREEEAIKRGLISENLSVQGDNHPSRNNNKNKKVSSSSIVTSSSSSPHTTSSAPSASVVTTLYRESTLSTNLNTTSDVPTQQQTGASGTYSSPSHPDHAWAIPEEDPLDAPNSIIGGGYVIGGIIKMVAWGRQRELVERCREELRKVIDKERVKRQEQKLQMEMLVATGVGETTTNAFVQPTLLKPSDIVAVNSGSLFGGSPSMAPAAASPQLGGKHNHHQPTTASSQAADSSNGTNKLLIMPGPSLTSLHEYHCSESAFTSSVNVLNEYRHQARAVAEASSEASASAAAGVTSILPNPPSTSSSSVLPAATRLITNTHLMDPSIKLHPPSLNPQVSGFVPPPTTYALQLIDEPLNPHITEHHKFALPEEVPHGSSKKVSAGTTTMLRELSKSVMSSYVDPAFLGTTEAQSNVEDDNQHAITQELQQERKFQHRLSALMLDVKGPPLTPPPSPVRQRKDHKSPFIIKGAAPIDTTNELSNGYKLDDRGLCLLQRRAAPSHHLNNSNKKNTAVFMTQTTVDSSSTAASTNTVIHGPPKAANAIQTIINKNILSAGAPSYHKALLALESTTHHSKDNPIDDFEDGNSIPLPNTFLQDSWRRSSPVAVLQRLVEVQDKLLELSESALGLTSTSSHLSSAHVSRISSNYRPQILFPSPISIFSGKHKGGGDPSGGATPALDTISVGGVGSSLFQMLSDISKRGGENAETPNERKKRDYQCVKIASALEPHIQSSQFPVLLRRVYQYFHGVPVLVENASPCNKSHYNNKNNKLLTSQQDLMDMSFDPIVGVLDDSMTNPLMVLELPTPTNNNKMLLATPQHRFQRTLSQEDLSSSATAASVIDPPHTATTSMASTLSSTKFDERVSVDVAVQHRQLEEHFFEVVLGWTKDEDFLSHNMGAASTTFSPLRPHGSNVGSAPTVNAIPFWQTQIAALLLRLDVNQNVRVPEVTNKLFSDLSIISLDCSKCLLAKFNKPSAQTTSSLSRQASFSRDTLSPRVANVNVELTTEDTATLLPVKRTHSTLSTIGRTLSKLSLISPDTTSGASPTSPHNHQHSNPTTLKEVIKVESGGEINNRITKTNPYEIISRFVNISRFASLPLILPTQYATAHQAEGEAAPSTQALLQTYISTKCGKYMVVPSKSLVFYRGVPVPLSQPSNSTIYNTSDVSSKQHDLLVSGAITVLSHLSDLVRIIVRQRADEAERAVEETMALKRNQNRQVVRRSSAANGYSDTTPMFNAELSLSTTTVGDFQQLPQLLPLTLTIEALSTHSVLPLPFLSLFSRLTVLLDVLASSASIPRSLNFKTLLRNDATISAPLARLVPAIAQELVTNGPTAALQRQPLPSHPSLGTAASVSLAANINTSAAYSSSSYKSAPNSRFCRNPTRSHTNSVALRRKQQEEALLSAVDDVGSYNHNYSNMSEEEALRADAELMAALNSKVSHEVARRKKAAEVDLMMQKVNALARGSMSTNNNQYDFQSPTKIKDQLMSHLGHTPNKKGDDDKDEEIWEVASWRPKTPTGNLRLRRDLALSSHSGSVTRERPPTPPTALLRKKENQQQASPASPQQTSSPSRNQRPSSPGRISSAPQSVPAAVHTTPVRQPLARASKLPEARWSSSKINSNRSPHRTQYTSPILTTNHAHTSSSRNTSHQQLPRDSSPSTNTNQEEHNSSEMPNFFGGPGGGLSRRDMINVLLSLPKPAQQQQ